VHLVRHAPDPEKPFDLRIARMIDAYRDGLRPLLGRFDLVHAQDCLSANAALELRAEGAIEHVLRTIHHVDEFRSPSLVECQDRSIRRPDLVLCVSQPWVERVHAQFSVEAGLVSNGVDARRFRPPDDLERARDRAALGVEDRLCVLTIGGIEPRKGSLALLAGFAALRERLPARRPLLLIGGGATLFDYREEVGRFRAAARDLGVADDVRALGPLSDADVERAYRAADVLAFPSTVEGFGLVPLEALAAGLPVVASDLDVFRPFLRDGETALLVPAGDGAALGDALARLAGDDALAGRLRRAGRSVAEGFSWERSAQQHEAVYRSFLRRTARLAARA
jgi:glycosyltransferase-like protein